MLNILYCPFHNWHDIIYGTGTIQLSLETSLWRTAELPFHLTSPPIPLPTPCAEVEKMFCAPLEVASLMTVTLSRALEGWPSSDSDFLEAIVVCIGISFFKLAVMKFFTLFLFS